MNRDLIRVAYLFLMLVLLGWRMSFGHSPGVLDDSLTQLQGMTRVVD